MTTMVTSGAVPRQRRKLKEGETQQIHFELPAEMLKQIDQVAESLGGLQRTPWQASLHDRTSKTTWARRNRPAWRWSSTWYRTETRTAPQRSTRACRRTVRSSTGAEPPST